MSVSRLLVGAAMLPLLSVALAACGKGSAPIIRGNEVALARNTGSQPPECGVKDIKKIVEGTRPDWAPNGALIGYDKPVKDTSEVFLANPDGSNSRCITCGSEVPKEIRNKHKGKITFHPDMTHVLISAENEHGTHGFTSTPGVGDNHDFWMTDLTGSKFWRLTTLPKDTALQYPRFSPDGRKLLWSQRYEKGRMMTKGSEFGRWHIKMADVVFGPQGPRLANIVELEPGGKGFYEPHGFSPDGKRIIFTAMLRPEKSQVYGEIYIYDLATKTLTNIAKADDLHFEQALFAPSGKRISFMSGPFIGLLRMGYKSDIYLMDPDGGNRVRVTHFNEPGYPESTGADTLVDKDVWSPDGTRLAVGSYVHAKKEHGVYVVTFKGPCGRI